MSLWLHEIAEANHRILNPFTDDKLMLLGEVCRVGDATNLLDLACGKGETLCRWAQRFGSRGHGVDISEVFLTAARRRAAELGVVDRVSFEQRDATGYHGDEPYDVVSCLGATWIGGGLLGTIELMNRSVKPAGLLVVGEPYWVDTPPPQAYEALGFGPDDYASLAGTLRRFETAGADLVEMVLADGDSWDRYEAAHWWTLRQWLGAHPDDRRATELRQFRDRNRHAYLAFERRYLGWGAFVLRPPTRPVPPS